MHFFPSRGIEDPYFDHVNWYINGWYNIDSMKLRPWCQIAELLLEEIDRTMNMPMVFRYITPAIEAILIDVLLNQFMPGHISAYEAAVSLQNKVTLALLEGN